MHVVLKTVETENYKSIYLCPMHYNKNPAMMLNTSKNYHEITLLYK